MFGHGNVRTMSSTHARNNASAFKNLVLVWGPRICACTRAYIKRQTNINAHAFTKRFVYIIMCVYIYIFHSFPRVEISSRSTYGAQIPEKKVSRLETRFQSGAERCGSTNCVSFKPNNNNNNNTKKLRVLLTLPWMNPLFIKTTPGFPASSSSSFLSSQKAENFSAGRVSAALAPVALAQQRRR